MLPDNFDAAKLEILHVIAPGISLVKMKGHELDAVTRDSKAIIAAAQKTGARMVALDDYMYVDANKVYFVEAQTVPSEKSTLPIDVPQKPALLTFWSGHSAEAPVGVSFAKIIAALGD